MKFSVLSLPGLHHAVRLRSLIVVFGFALVGLGAQEAFAQELTDRIGVWNGYQRQLNVVECVNASSSDADASLSLKSNAGLAIATVQFTVSAFGSRHVILNDFDIADHYGTYVVRSKSHRSLRCLTAFYRLTNDTDKPVEYAFSLPLLETLHGRSAGTFNSMNPAGGREPAYNWLSILRADERPFHGQIELFDLEGRLTKTLEIPLLAPEERRDFAVAHEDGQTVGLYRIVPDENAGGYAAFLSRFQLGDNGRFDFGFVTTSQGGSCDEQVLSASTMGPATNWLELANPTEGEIVASVELRNAEGQTRTSERYALSPFSQRHVYLNASLGEWATGTLSVRCLGGIPKTSGLIAQSMFYGHPQVGGAEVRWAYSTEGFEQLRGDVAVSSINTYLSAANWLKSVPSISEAPPEVQIFRELGEALLATSMTTRTDLALHQFTGPDVVGLLLAARRDKADPRPTYAGELIRVYYGANGISSIMKVAALEQVADDESDAPSSTSSSSSAETSSSTSGQTSSSSGQTSSSGGSGSSTSTSGGSDYSSSSGSEISSSSSSGGSQSGSSSTGETEESSSSSNQSSLTSSSTSLEATGSSSGSVSSSSADGGDPAGSSGSAVSSSTSSALGAGSDGLEGEQEESGGASSSGSSSSSAAGNISSSGSEVSGETGSSSSSSSGSGSTEVVIPEGEGSSSSGVGPSSTSSSYENSSSSAEPESQTSSSSSSNGGGLTTSSSSTSSSSSSNSSSAPPPVPLGALIVSEGELISEGVVPGSIKPSGIKYVLTNAGSSTLAWSAEYDESWLKLSKTSGTIRPGQRDEVVVSFKKPLLTEAGFYSDEILFVNLTNGDGGGSRVISVRLNMRER